MQEWHRRSISLPKELNQQAIDYGINVSSLTREAIRHRIEIINADKEGKRVDS